VDSAIRSKIYITTKDSFDTIYKKVYDYLGYKDGYKYWLEIGAPKNLNDFNKILQAQESKSHNYDNDLTVNIIYKVNLILHDFKVLDKLNNPKVVMGGSWNDGPAFLERGVKQAYSHNESHSTIGFRVVASSMIDELDNP
jgi:NDP-sugar pyrophosphorylase family protein